MRHSAVPPIYDRSAMDMAPHMDDRVQSHRLYVRGLRSYNLPGILVC